MFRALAVFFVAVAAVTLTVEGRSVQTHNSDTSNFIVGGDPAEPGQFPHQVVLVTSSGYPFCGGTFICRDWVLTAAHCISGNSIWVAYGSNTFGGMNTAENFRQVVQAYVHESYGGGSLRNDIALLKLASPIVCTDEASTIALEQEEQCGFTGSTPPDVIVSGHGATQEGSSMTSTLQYVLLSMNTVQECQNAYGSSIRPGMECASEAGKDSCQGDSGGPLVTTSDLQTGDTVCGIVSWGHGCARPGYPGVYTDVAYYLGWIENKLSQNGGCETCDSGTTEGTTQGGTTEGTTQGGTTEGTTQGGTTEGTTEGDTTEGTTEGNTTEGTTEGDTTEGTTEGDTTEGTTQGGTTEGTTQGGTTEGTTQDTAGTEGTTDGCSCTCP